MKFKIILSAAFFLLLFVMISSINITAQEIPNESGNNDQIFIDTIETSENLLDSNEVYKQQFEELSEDGDWIKIKKKDFIEMLTEETGENLQYYYSENGEYIYVWQPYVAVNEWNPYVGGRWEFSYYGWTWVSDYAWGWGPYNYGRWYCSSYYGWFWLPGNVWAANWVTWRNCGGYYAWYPICPYIYWYNYGYGGYCHNRLYTYTPSNWVVVKKSDITKRIDEKVVGDPVDNINILTNSTKMDIVDYSDKETKTFKHNGPDVKQVTKESGEKVTPKYVAVNNTKSGKYDEGVNYSNNRKTKSSSDGYNPTTTKNEKVTKNSTTKTNTTTTTNTKNTKSSKDPNDKKYNPPTKNSQDVDKVENSKKPKVKNNEKKNNNTKKSGDNKSYDTKKGNDQNKVKSNSGNSNKSKGNNKSGKSSRRSRSGK